MGWVCATMWRRGLLVLEGGLLSPIPSSPADGPARVSRSLNFLGTREGWYVRYGRWWGNEVQTTALVNQRIDGEMDGPGLAWTRVLCRHTRPCTYARRRDRDRALGLGLKQGAEGATVLCGMGRVGRGISKSCRTCEVERRASTSEVTEARERELPPCGQQGTQGMSPR
jgi:hypothetical protein